MRGPNDCLKMIFWPSDLCSSRMIFTSHSGLVFLTILRLLLLVLWGISFIRRWLWRKVLSSTYLPRKDLQALEEATRIRVLPLVQDCLGDPNVKPQDLHQGLHLATTVFLCNLCLRFLSFPGACIYPCASNQDELNRFHTLCGLVDVTNDATS
jgi:hypothetical protein